MKPAETRVRAEPTPSPQFPFTDTPETYKSQAGIEVKKEIGVSISDSTVREERFEVLHGCETKVGDWIACCFSIHPTYQGLAFHRLYSGSSQPVVLPLSFTVLKLNLVCQSSFPQIIL